MTDTNSTIRIFISSPGDVVEERDRARRVIEGLERLYPGATLQAVLWEELALPATASFQESIDFILQRQPIDVAVFILWSRLGTPLGAASTRPDGTPYRSGTEREFDLMLAAFEQSGRERPVILAYARDDDSGFKQKLTEVPKSELSELIEQRELADAFIREQFHDAEGRNLRAYQTYREPVGFAQRLRVHLRQSLDDLLGVDAAPRWLDEPYRGLQVFDVQHAPIFHGRDEETCDLLQRLRDQQRAGCAFAVIVGASGSGKSSLARAGVAASLVQHAGDDDVGHWRTAVYIPALATAPSDRRTSSTGEDSDSEQDTRPFGRELCAALVRTLSEALPEWETAGIDRNEIAAGLAQDAVLTVKLSIAPAFARAARETRLLLVLDQMEELWTDRRITSEDRDQFLLAIEALARSGHVSVLATLRSDFYPQAQQMPTFLRLKGQQGHFDLLPPGPAALSRLITEPARLAGVRFERHESSGRSLDQVILEDAAGDPAALPLLEYTLDELYRQCVQSPGERTSVSGAESPPEGGSISADASPTDTKRADRSDPAAGGPRLTFAAYESLGGVEGALGQRAEAVVASLPDDAQAALPEILARLITVDIAGDQTAVRRRAPLTELTATPAQEKLTSSLIAARFLTADTTGRVDPSHRSRVESANGVADADATDAPGSQRPEASARQMAIAGLAHEALLSRWSRVADWIRDNREHLRLRARVEQSQQRWDQHGQDDSLLLPSGLPLEEGRRLLRDAPQLLSDQTGEYVRASIARDERQSQRRRRRTQAVVCALSLLTVLALIGGVIAVWQAGVADAERDIAVINQEEANRQARLAENARGDAERQRNIAEKNEAEAERERQIAEDEKEKAEQQLYFSQMYRAAGDIEAGRQAHAASLLRTIPFERRQWEARYLKRQAKGTPLTLRGHTDEVISVSFSPDGQRIVSGSSNPDDDPSGEVKVWDATSGALTLTLRGHAYGVTSVSFSPDGQRIVSGGLKTVKVWDATSGKETLTLRGRTGIVFSVSFSPDGQRIVSPGWDKTVKVWDATSGKETLTLRGHTDGVTSVSFSPDGQRIVSGGWDKTVKVWDATSGEETLTLRGHTACVRSVSFSPDGQRIVSASVDKTVKVWDATSGEETLTLRGHTDAVESVSFSPDGQRIVSGSGNPLLSPSPGELKVWDATSGALALTLHTDRVTSVSFSPDGQRIVSVSRGYWFSRGKVKVWDAASGEETLTLRGHTDRVTSVSFSSDGQRIVSGSEDETVKVWDTTSGALALTLRGHTDLVTSVSFSPDGQRIVSGSLDKTVKVWDATSGALALTLRGHTSNVTSVSFSPDGQRIVSGSLDKTVKVWDATSGALTLTLHTDRVTSVSFSPDGQRIVSGSTDKTVKVWDATSGALALTLREHTDAVESVSFSPDGQRIVSGSDDKTVKVWDATSGEDTLTLRGHTTNVTSVSFSPDGQRIVSRDTEGEVIVWDAATGERVSQEPPAQTPTDRHVSPSDPRLRVFPSGRNVLLVRRNPENWRRLWAEDAARRAARAPAWHRQNAATAEDAKDWFAARFHLRRLSVLKPDDESVQNRLEHAETMLAAERLRHGAGKNDESQQEVQP